MIGTVNRPRAHLAVELEVGADPIQGSLRTHDGTEARFAGWLELVRLLETAAEGADEGDAEREVETTTEERPDA
jgi:hypothetical protein